MPKLGDVCAAGVQDLYHLRRIEQSEQEMLHGDKFVLLFARLLERFVEAVFEFAR